jgi:SAM-dependent methyltransferase
MPEITPDPIFQVATGFMAAKHLFAANEVGLFEKLAEEPATLDELTQRTGIPRRTLRMVVDAMVALGFIERQGEHYRNGPVAAVFLSGRTPADLRPFLRFWNHLSYPRWEKLEEAIRTDQPPFGELEFTEAQQRLFSEGVEAITAGSAQALARIYDFSHHHRVLDLGGGTGSFLTAILQKNREIKGTLFELAPVAAIARRRLTNTPVAERIEIVEGDFFRDPIPDGHDVVIIANVIHGLSAARNLELLGRIRGRVPDGARLLLVDFWTDPTHTRPLMAALMAGEFLLNTGGGDIYSEEEAREWLQQSGWRVLEHKLLVGPASLIVAETAE